MELNEHPFLSFFPKESGDRLTASAELRAPASGDFLLREGDAPDSLYLILEGSAAIRKKDPDGKPVLLGYVHEGDFVGEFGLIDHAPRCADVQAASALRVAAIPRDAVLHALRDPSALFRLAAHTIDRMRSANQRHVEDLIRQERMSLLGGMMNGILHDFRNPFAVISMASDCILQSSPDAQPFCEIISQQIERMTHMAEDILDFSRGRTELEKEPFKVSELFEQFRALYEEYFSQLEIALQIEPSALQICGDRSKLMRVLQNLTGNAAQAMRPDGGKLMLSARQEGSEIVLCIADNGPGIPEEIQHNLFDAFSTSGKKDGVGIGLAVTHSIVKAHGGGISFSTEASRGTTFFIRLPAAATKA